MKVTTTAIHLLTYSVAKLELKTSSIPHCKYLNPRSECNDIVISIYSHYLLDPNAKSFDTNCIAISIKCFCILIERVMTVNGNYDVIAFRSCIQIFTVIYSGDNLWNLRANTIDSKA